MMALAAVARRHGDELACDFAEEYHVLDWRALPLPLAATLASGLRAGSRVRMAESGAGGAYTFQELLLARASDALEWLAWSRTRDAQANRNRPDPILAAMVPGAGGDERPMAFDTAEGYEAARRRIAGR